MRVTKEKLKKIFSNLNLKETIALTWSVSPRWTLITITVLMLENICWMGSVFSLKLLIDHISKPLLHNSRKDLLYYIFLSGSVSIFYVCVKSLSAYFNEVHATKVNHSIDQKIHAHSLKLDFGFYEDPEYLDILNRAREAGVDRPYAVVSSLLDIVKNLVMLASIGYILVNINWILLPLLALSVLPILIVRIKFSKKLFYWKRKNTGTERQAGYLSFLMTSDISAKEVRSFSLGNFLYSRYTSIRQILLSQQMKMNRRKTAIESVTTILGTGIFFAVTAYIILGTLDGKTSISDITIFLVIFPQSFSIMQGLIGAIARLYQNNIFVSNIFELLNLSPSIENTLPRVIIPASRIDADITMNNVSFRYMHSKELVLDNVSISIPSGKIVALVGLNGAGKSTLIKLLCRLYDPVKGTIHLGKNNVRDFDIGEYRKQVSVVFQDFVRYNLSVADNIGFGDVYNKAKREEIIEAAKNAGAHHFIINLPDGYDTILGRVFDEGYEISIGQWQKLAIARAFYSHSRLVILDEATSALDTVSESELFHSFRQRIGSRSALIISHRLSTIRQADYIYVMADKHVKECGTHEELLSMEGNYASFYSKSLQ